MKETYGTTIFCDDVREEIGGKKTFVGCYLDSIVFAEPLPALLPTFVIHTTVLEDFEDANSTLNVKLIYEKDNGSEDVIFDADLPSDRGARVQKSEDDTRLATILSLKTSPIVFDASGRLKVRGYRGESEIKLGSIKIIAPSEIPSTDKSA